jgi:hypothetical protein
MLATDYNQSDTESPSFSFYELIADLPGYSPNLQSDWYAKKLLPQFGITPGRDMTNALIDLIISRPDIFGEFPHAYAQALGVEFSRLYTAWTAYLVTAWWAMIDDESFPDFLFLDISSAPIRAFVSRVEQSARIIQAIADDGFAYGPANRRNLIQQVQHLLQCL